ncbi:MAG: RES family NAD+ phosphorylase [Sphaerobacter sp.]|nr:RES family NAD+ phosphorylase [Sphaerobacter sp.]
MADQLVAVPPPTTPVYRVARGADPFAPPGWAYANQDGTFGNRFDDPGARAGIPESERFRVIYCATQRAAAFGETIARMRPSLALIAQLNDIDDEEPLEQTLHGVVDPEDARRGLVTREWRLQRRLGATYLDPSLRFVDIAAPETMTHLRSALATCAAALGIHDIDLSAITSGQRRFTQECARYIYEQADDAGRPCFAGIRYPSRLNPDWECWAIFDTRMVHQRCPTETIHPNDPGVWEAARLLGLSIEGVRKGDFLRPWREDL